MSTHDAASPHPKPTGVNPKDLIGATKPPLHLLPSAALIEMAMVMGEGARKYGPFNWREPGKAVGSQAYTSAAMRHILAYQDGEDIDPESGRPHLALAMAGLGILIDAKSCGNMVDDRPTPAPTAQMIRDYTKQTPPAHTAPPMARQSETTAGPAKIGVSAGFVTVNGKPVSKKWEDHLDRLIRQELNAYPVGATMPTRKLAELIHAAWLKETNEITGIEPVEEALVDASETHPQYSLPNCAWVSLGPTGNVG